MPTEPKPPPEHDVAQLVLGLFDWLRDNGHTTAAVPARARKAVATGLSGGKLKGLAETIGTAFLLALDTWIRAATPLMRERSEHSAKKELVSTVDAWRRDDELRTEAIRLLQGFSFARLSKQIEEIADISSQCAAHSGASVSDQQRTREKWLEDSAQLGQLLRGLEQRLRAPRGVPFPRTLKEWTQFEQRLVQSLRQAGLSYGEIAKLRRPAVRGGETPPDKHRLERERVRGSARRAKSRKA